VTAISERTHRAGPALVAVVVEAVRPREWVKHTVVVALPLASGRVTDTGAPGRLALAFVAFCCVASGAYMFNDARDAEEDRPHPRKRSRPIGSGRLGALDTESAPRSRGRCRSSRPRS
jgi:4-hydroxybenzoate polyprenyltransferase